MDNRPIGVFDSGLGGLTAVKKLHEILPDEDIIYFGDRANAPYGGKSYSTLFDYSKNDISFLEQFNPKVILAACGTVSSTVLPELSEKIDIPIMGVVDSTAEKAAALTKNKRIAIFATEATVQCHAYEKAIKKTNNEIVCMEIPCPKLVPIIEEGIVDEQRIKTAIHGYTDSMIGFDADTIILGCTHFPLIKLFFEEELGRVNYVEAGNEAAYNMKKYVETSGIAADHTNDGHVAYYFSGSDISSEVKNSFYFKNILFGKIHIVKDQ